MITIFKSFNTENLDSDNIHPEYSIEQAKEEAKIELEEKLASPTPRFGFTTDQKFVSKEEYEEWLLEVFEEELSEFVDVVNTLLSTQAQLTSFEDEC